MASGGMDASGSTLVSPAVTGIVCLWQLKLDRVIIISCVFPRFNVRFASAAHDEACRHCRP